MIKVTDVQYGVMPYSAGVGQAAIGVYFEDDEEQFNFEGLDEAKDSDTIQGMYADVATKMYNKILELVEKRGIKDIWNAGLAFEKGIYVAFIGDVCVKDDYFYPYNMLLNLINKESIARQQMSEAFIKARADHRMPRLNPPRFVVVAKPTNPMVLKNPYEACSFVVAKLMLRTKDEEISDSNKDNFYHINSIMNIGKHPFGTYVFRPETEEDLTKFEEAYGKLPFEHIAQIYVVPSKGTKAFRDTCYKWALDKGYRAGANLESSLALNFDD